MANKKVKMLVKISGSHDGKDWPEIGDEVTLPATEADAMIRNGMAAPAGASVQENAMLDAPGVETAADLGTEKGQKSVRLQMDPPPHADEPDAFHVPAMPGEQAAAEAGQAEVDKANEELLGKETVAENKAVRARKVADK
jgi:hypothetical protein